MNKVSIKKEPQLSRKYGVIAVGDLEDFSLWCQAVDSEVVGTYYRRFLWTLDSASKLFNCSFWKSTGDGFIAIWHLPIPAEIETSMFIDSHQDSIVDMIECAVAFSEALEMFTDLGFGLSWPTPRDLRSAIHSGVIFRAVFKDEVAGSPEKEEYVGEALNAACRMEKYGGGFPGPVLTEHVSKIIARDPEGRLVIIEDTAQGDVNSSGSGLPKAASWIAKRVFRLPSFSVFQMSKDSPFIDSNGNLVQEAKGAIDVNITSMFYQLLAGANRLEWHQKERIDTKQFPPWMRDIFFGLVFMMHKSNIVDASEFVPRVISAIQSAMQRYESRFGKMEEEIPIQQITEAMLNGSLLDMMKEK